MAGRRAPVDVSRMADPRPAPTLAEMDALRQELEDERRIRQALAKSNELLRTPHKPVESDPCSDTPKPQFHSLDLGGRDKPESPQGLLDIHLENGQTWASVPVRLNLDSYKFQQKSWRDKQTGELRKMNNYVIGETRIRESLDTVIFRFPSPDGKCQGREMALNVYCCITLSPFEMEAMRERRELQDQLTKLTPSRFQEAAEDTDDISRTGEFTPSAQASNGPEIQRNPNLEDPAPHKENRLHRDRRNSMPKGGLDPADGIRAGTGKKSYKGTQKFPLEP